MVMMSESAEIIIPNIKLRKAGNSFAFYIPYAYVKLGLIDPSKPYKITLKLSSLSLGGMRDSYLYRTTLPTKRHLNHGKPTQNKSRKRNPRN
jgi:hypothetical protein